MWYAVLHCGRAEEVLYHDQGFKKRVMVLTGAPYTILVNRLLIFTSTDKLSGLQRINYVFTLVEEAFQI